LAEYNILLVEDEVLERQAVRFILENRCSAPIKIVGEAENGFEAVRLAEELKPDILLLDIHMPGQSGLEVMRQMKQAYSSMSYIIFTAYDEFDYALEAINNGAFRYILKPAKPEEIVSAVENLVRNLTYREKKIKAEEKLKQQLQSVIPYIESSLVTDLLSGNMLPEKDIDNRLQFLGINEKPNCCLVADICNFSQTIEGFNEIQTQDLKNKVFKIIKETVNAYHPSIVVPYGSDRIVCFIATKQNSLKLLDLAEEISQNVSKNTPVTVSIGIGETFDKINNLRLSYFQALEAEKTATNMLGNNTILHFSHIKHLRQPDSDYPYEIEKQILELVRLGDAKETTKALNQLIEELFRKKIALKEIKARLDQLFILLTRTLIHAGANSKDVENIRELALTQLLQINNFPEFKSWTENVVQLFINCLYRDKQIFSSEVIDKVCEYIRNNYYKDINLYQLARLSFLHPNYLCQLFKKNKSCTISQYLTNIRLKKAQEFLATTNKTIAEIAQAVGYKDANYFSRIFSKHLGMSPTQYRENNLK